MYTRPVADQEPTISSHRLAAAVAAAALVATGAAHAQVAKVLVSELDCIPRDGNAAVSIGLVPDLEAADVRVYFRRQGYGDFYFVPADAEGGGAYWGVLPVPAEQNELAEYYVGLFGPDGAYLGQSPVATAPVTEDCVVELTDEQFDRANELTIGETALGQKYLKPAWWLCDGVVDRIDLFGELRDDQSCAPVIVAGGFPWAQVLVPAGLVGGTISIDEVLPPGTTPPVSPSTP